jgi:hypothetical protein
MNECNIYESKAFRMIIQGYDTTHTSIEILLFRFQNFAASVIVVITATQTTASSILYVNGDLCIYVHVQS